jgi:hypothetical protein
MKLIQHRALKEVQSTTGETERQVSDLTKRHTNEIKLLKEKFAIEKDELKAIMLK